MDSADLPILFERIFNSCSKDALLIIDTNISPTPRQSVQLTSGQIVCGSFWEEHPKGLSLVQRLSNVGVASGMTVLLAYWSEVLLTWSSALALLPS